MAVDIFLDVCGSTVDESMYNQGPRWLPPPSKPLVPLYTSKLVGSANKYIGCPCMVGTTIGSANSGYLKFVAFYKSLKHA